jgi:diacylglycerol kinase family enzyme
VPAAYLFANPTARSGRGADLIRKARALLDGAGVDHEFVPTAPDGGTVGLVRRAIDDHGARLVIYMGGDGTFAEIARGILASEHAAEVRMGMLPTGTANDQGKSFGLRAGARALRENVELIAAGLTAELDVGRLQRLDEADRVTHSELFFDSFSVGFGASVLKTRNRDRTTASKIPVMRRLYRDQLVYAGALVQRMIGSYVEDITFDLEAVLDGREVVYHRSLIDVIVKNTVIYGGEWALAPDGAPDDGAFELVPIAGRAELSSKILATLRHGPIDEETLRALGIELSRPARASSMTLTIMCPGAPAPPAAQVDGEEFPAGDRFRIDVLPRLLKVIVPGRR